MTQVCMVSSAAGGMALVAGMDAGVVPPPMRGERLLLVTNNAPAPELTRAWHLHPAGRILSARFDRVVVLNDDLHPFHPQRWDPSDEDLPLMARALRSHWGLGDDPVELVVESLHVPPAATLCRIFHSSPITVLSHDLASYGPSRFHVPLLVAQRLERLCYLDILDGVGPLLLGEHEVSRYPIPLAELERLSHTVADALDPTALPLGGLSERPTSIVIGQDLVAREILSAEEDGALALSMIDAAVESGAERVVFVVQAETESTPVVRLKSHTESRGAEFVESSPGDLPEVLAASAHLHSAVSCFASELLVLDRAYSVRPLSHGTADLLERLSPFQHGDRTPVTIVDALTREGSPYSEPERLEQLLSAVAYCMQPAVCAHLRPVAERVLEQMTADERARYFKRRRLTSLGLPGGNPDGAHATRGARLASRARRAIEGRLGRSGDGSPENRV